MKAHCYYLVSGSLFALVALAHLLRLIFGLSVYIDNAQIPMWISGFGFAIPTLLAIMAFRLACH